MMERLPNKGKDFFTIFFTLFSVFIVKNKGKLLFISVFSINYRMGKCLVYEKVLFWGVIYRCNIFSSYFGFWGV